ncbi:hypothetical protein [Limimaricola cinnabarinus]|uniref:hypothetical protein n=1 Tax=Limimaricola cinnabarinus TaxID=1125964 RepID=UPI0024920FAB|nr:hypothetical protein [Limimaricola cinnabarinus]
MTRAPNWSLDAVCEEIESHDLTPAQEADLCGLILGELQARRENRAEATYDEARREAVAEWNEAYRRNMIAAGRGGMLG